MTLYDGYQYLLCISSSAWLGLSNYLADSRGRVSGLLLGTVWGGKGNTQGRAKEKKEKMFILDVGKLSYSMAYFAKYSMLC